MKRFRTIIAILLVLVMTLSLSGCSFNSTMDDLFVLPQVPVEFSELTDKLENLLTSGYSYVSPISGDNIQSLQLHDFDGDGESEAFVLMHKEDEKNPLKVFIYKKGQNGYELFSTIESSGSNIDSIHYVDVNNDKRSELVIGWEMSDNVHSLVVYSISRESVQLMSTNYSKFDIVEFEDNNNPNILVLRSDVFGMSVADLYQWQTDLLAKESQCNLSSTSKELENGSLVVGELKSGQVAIFVTGITSENLAKTDILVCDTQRGLENIVWNHDTQSTEVVYPYRQLIPQDIDKDGSVEIPCPQRTYDNNGTEVVSVDTIVAWNAYAYENNNYEVEKKEETYHCQSAGWYVTLQTDWWGNSSATIMESGTNETEVLINIDAEQVVAFYTITGENRENRGLLGNRFVVKRQTNTVIAAEIFDQGQILGMTEDLLRKNFHLIVNSWGATE